jgi:hypothetical protein
VSGGASYLPTLTHEVVHSLMQTDFPGAPLWINEAIASLFEAPVFSKDGGIHGVRRNWRHDQLRDALADARTRDKVRMDALFRMNGIEFRAISDDRESVDKERNLLHCAVARAFAAPGGIHSKVRRSEGESPDPFELLNFLSILFSGIARAVGSGRARSPASGLGVECRREPAYARCPKRPTLSFTTPT